MALTNEVADEILETGHNFAGELLHSAITNAENEKQAKNQVIVLQVMAIRLLATVAFNYYKSEGGDPLKFLDNILKQTKADFQYLKENEDELEIAEPKGESTDG